MKQAIIVRKDIKMSKGKIAAQVAHAAVSSYIETCKLKKEWAEKWIEEGQKKVVLKVNSLNELIEIKNKAEKEGIPNSLIIDAGLTEVEPGTITCLGIGPAPCELIDKIIAHLKLL
ncbi:MAG: peptidyl-tRNA hydrolase Pth2 [Candidatus Verstraetearchaeota archaeon]|jgi:PTH2 family peptidyl-tRNA hydrolase|nr:peptidyl-tRNA hydrolase Pth2 [Candidatus Verstraetearchaeota archaeon]